MAVYGHAGRNQIKPILSVSRFEWALVVLQENIKSSGILVDRGGF